MEKRRRREILQIGGVTLASGLAGCSVLNSSNTISPSAELIPTDGTWPDGPGGSRAAALSRDGTTAIVGVAGGGGVVYVFTRDGGSWSQQAEFTGTIDQDLGETVDISADGTTAIIGDPQSESGEYQEAHVIRRSADGEWSYQATLKTLVDDAFGESVAISDDGTTAVVGAPDAEGNAAGSGEVGAVHPLSLSDGEWNDQGPLNGSGGSGSLGNSVDLNSDGLIIASDVDRALVFFQEEEGWGRSIISKPEEVGNSSTFARDIAAGSHFWLVSNLGDTGTVYHYRDTIGDYDEKISVGDSSGHFALSGNSKFLLVDSNPPVVFKRDEGKWNKQSKLVLDDTDSRSVALSHDGTTALVGTASSDSPNEPPLAYIFDLEE